MDVGDFNFKTDFDKQCGEIFLTIKGKMMFHCTLCEGIYKEFDDYADHITRLHILETIEENIPNQSDPLHTNDVDDDDKCQGFSDVSSFEIENLSSEKTQMNLLFDDTGIETGIEQMEEDYSSQGSSGIWLEPKETTDHKETVTENQLDSSSVDEIEQNSSTKTRRKRNANQKSGDRIHKCYLCEFSCNDRSNLISHTRRHSADRPYHCPECPKAFYTRTELKTHYRMHTGERPFLCTICGRSFKTSGILNDHIKRHKNIRSKECDICGKRFYNKDMLRKHLATHSDERPFQCTVCNAGFKQENGLRNHKKIHENKREYECEICSAGFNQKPGLYSHMKSKHSFKPSPNIAKPQINMDDC